MSKRKIKKRINMKPYFNILLKKEEIQMKKLIPRVYECKDVWMITWLGYEFIIRKDVFKF